MRTWICLFIACACARMRVCSGERQANTHQFAGDAHTQTPSAWPKRKGCVFHRFFFNVPFAIANRKFCVLAFSPTLDSNAVARRSWNRSTRCSSHKKRSQLNKWCTHTHTHTSRWWDSVRTKCVCIYLHGCTLNLDLLSATQQSRIIKERATCVTTHTQNIVRHTQM